MIVLWCYQYTRKSFQIRWIPVPPVQKAKETMVSVEIVKRLFYYFPNS